MFFLKKKKKGFGSLAHNKHYIHVSLYHHFNKCVLYSSFFFFPSKFYPKPSFHAAAPVFLREGRPQQKSRSKDMNFI